MKRNTKTNTAPAPTAPMAATAPAQAKPRQVITGGTRTNTKGKEVQDVFLSYSLNGVLAKKYGDGAASDLTAWKRGCDALVAQGIVKVPTGWHLVPVVKRAWDKVIVVAEPITAERSSRKAAMPSFNLPD